MPAADPVGAEFRILITEDQRQAAGERAVRCASCKRAGDAGHDPWRGYCLPRRVMVSNTFPKICSEYQRA